MSFTTPEFSAIRQAILADLLSLDPQQASSTDSDNYIRASGFASAVEGLYQHQQWAVRQQFPDTADSDYLEHHANLHGLERKPAVAATGVLQVTGTPGLALPMGTPFTATGASSQSTYITTGRAQIGVDGTALVSAQASTPGLAGNQAPNTPATFTSAPAGVDAAAVLVTMDSGADAESDAPLLARLLDLLRQPPRGGSKADWRRWALEVPGVANAYVFPLRQGVGTVDVCITSSTGVPSAALIQSVVDHIEPLRPVAMSHFRIVGPTLRPVAVSASLVLAPGTSLAVASAAITTSLQAYFASLAPGDGVYKSKIEALISETPGVLDRTVISPLANVLPASTALVIELARLGVVTLT